MIYVSRVVADSQSASDKAGIARLQASARMLGSENLRFRPVISRSVYTEQTESEQAAGWFSKRSVTGTNAYVRVGLEYLSSIEIGEVYDDLGRIFVATVGERSEPLNLIRPNPAKPGIQIFELCNRSFPNPIYIEAIPEDNGLHDPVEAGKHLDRRLSYKFRIVTVNDYPTGDDWNRLHEALEAGKRDVEKIPKEGFNWFQDVSTKGDIITLAPTKLEIYGHEIPLLNIDVEGQVRESKGKNLFDEIEASFNGFRAWYTGKTKDNLSRNSVINFLSKPKNRTVRYELEKARREHLEQRRKQLEEERGTPIEFQQLPEIEKYLGDGLDLPHFAAATRET
ncbi:MAG TPA: hypothetical protein VJA47_04300, partial [archaeon]|nr:hypothetical protein [archaeon]